MSERTEHQPHGGGEARLPIEKTYKLFVKGEFIRSESGRTLVFKDAASGGITNVARGSRKDLRDAVIATKAGFASWSSKTAMLRGQVLYRLAEVMEGRRAELVEARIGAGAGHAEAHREVGLAIDRVVHYAGWTDKFQALLSTLNPVAGPHFDVTSPEPVGVVAIAPPDVPGAREVGHGALLSLVTTVLPVIASGNGALVIAPEQDPRTTIVWCECLATSDLPAGVVNVLTGLRSELLPIAAKHMDIHALDLWRGGSVPRELATELARDAATNVKRVKVRDASLDLAGDAAEGLAFIEPFLEQKTVWHPVGI
jgi:acyl-CoA reductase-like NAD-dependent aldehyde dehydrogenase